MICGAWHLRCLQTRCEKLGLMRWREWRRIACACVARLGLQGIDCKKFKGLYAPRSSISVRVISEPDGVCACRWLPVGFRLLTADKTHKSNGPACTYTSRGDMRLLMSSGGVHPRSTTRNTQRRREMFEMETEGRLGCDQTRAGEGSHEGST